ANTGEVLRRYPKVVLPEMNMGQLALLLRSRYLVDVQSVTKVAGMAFLADELEAAIDAAIDGTLAEKETAKAATARSGAAIATSAVLADAVMVDEAAGARA
ncbi:MAG: 2-oxoglutarate ferredoxin oxidoreductase subunit alpha, partial [Mycobacterium sp.]